MAEDWTDDEQEEGQAESDEMEPIKARGEHEEEGANNGGLGHGSDGGGAGNNEGLGEQGPQTAGAESHRDEEVDYRELFFDEIRRLYMVPPDSYAEDLVPSGFFQWRRALPLTVSLKRTIKWGLCCGCARDQGPLVRVLRNYWKTMNPFWDDILFRGWMFKDLHLEYQDVNKLFRAFQRLDRDQSYDIDVFEILMFLNVDRTGFNEKILGAMDVDESGSINFMEFAASYWNMCTMNHEGVCKYLFYLYSESFGKEHEQRHMTLLGIERLIRDVFGDQWENNRNAEAAHRLLKRRLDFRERASGRFLEAHFIKLYIEEHMERFLFPAFRLQDDLRRRLFGVQWWKRQELRRRTRHDPVPEMLAVQALYRRHIEEEEKERSDFNKLKEPPRSPRIEQTEWVELVGPDGSYWTDGRSTIWEEPEELRTLVRQRLEGGWKPGKERWKVIDAPDGGKFFHNGRESVWEMPLEFKLLGEFRKLHHTKQADAFRHSFHAGGNEPPVNSSSSSPAKSSSVEAGALGGDGASNPPPPPAPSLPDAAVETAGPDRQGEEKGHGGSERKKHNSQAPVPSANDENEEGAGGGEAGLARKRPKSGRVHSGAT